MSVCKCLHVQHNMAENQHPVKEHQYTYLQQYSIGLWNKERVEILEVEFLCSRQNNVKDFRHAQNCTRVCHKPTST